jgi:DNA polymerase-3 subunit alpha
MRILLSPPRINGPSLFEDCRSPADETQPWDETTLLSNEKEALGFYISGHPMARYRKRLSTFDVIQVSDVQDRDDRAEVCIAGIISEIKNKARDKGITSYLTLEDETGICGAIVFSDLYNKNVDFLKKGNLVMIRGHVFRAEKGVKLIAREIQNLTELNLTEEEHTKYEVTLKCDTLEDSREKLTGIRRLMDVASNGKNNVSFRLYLPEYCVIITSKLQPTSNFETAVEKITGETVKVS